MYWCDLPVDAQLPEFWKRRPVVVVASDRTLFGAVTVVPCTSQDQEQSKWAVRLSNSIDGASSWVVCDKPSTVAVSRLHPDNRRPRVSQADFTAILTTLYNWLPKLQR